MKRDLLFIEKDRRIDAAVLEDGVLVEYWTGPTEQGVRPGEIYMGQILNRLTGLAAVFVDIGTGKAAFLPLDGKDLSAYPPGRELPVQIQKVPVGEKGAAVTDALSFTTPYVVLTPQDRRISVSGKIKDAAERDRLRAIGATLPGAGEEVGYILRTEAEGLEESRLEQEAEPLYRATMALQQQSRYTAVGRCLYQPSCPWMQPLRDWPEDAIDQIRTDSKDCYLALRQALQEKPSLSEKLAFHTDARWTLSDVTKITSQLERALAKQVFLPDGGYLFIEETEALAAIDVNSAKGIAGADKETAIYRINQQAARLALAQIRLRNLSGVILIDFIDMKDPQHRAALLSLVREEAKKDRRLVTVHGFTQLGLMEISRERRGLSLPRALA